MSNEAFLPVGLLDGAEPERVEAFLRALRSNAGMRARRESGRIHIRADSIAGPFIILKPLQNQEGSLREDAESTLVTGDFLTSDDQAAEIAAKTRQHVDENLVSQPQFRTNLVALYWHLLMEVDTPAVLRAYLADEGFEGWRLYRVQPTARFLGRSFVWRVLAAAKDGDYRLIDSEWPVHDASTGLASILPSHWVTGPLIARSQPFAAVFTTCRGAEIVSVSEGQWDRLKPDDEWPTPSGGVNLVGPGIGIYRTRHNTLDPTVPASLADDLLAGANNLIEQLTDPHQWTREGELHTEEQAIAWSTLDLGFSTVADLAKTWSSEESIWISFRALGILEGFWQGKDPKRFHLRNLVNPDRILEYAVPAIRNDWYRQWGEDIATNYGRQIRSMFGTDSTDEAVDHVVEIRNLVHGTGKNFPRVRGKRLRTLRELDVREAGLALLRDVAALWWMSVLLSPKTHGRIGVPPF